MGESELITLVVHTSERAEKLKEILEFHAIPVTFEEVNVTNEESTLTAVKVRIPVTMLPLGLKILESGDANTAPLAVMKMTGMSNNLLIPVDFSESSMLAIKIGFFLARKFQIEPMVMHAFMAPLYNNADPFAGALENSDVEEVIENDDLRKLAATRLSKFKASIIQKQKSGELPEMKFSTSLLEGVPEQVILEYCKSSRPFMVIMSTRGKNKKESDLVGSVTAEVIDSCRVPIMTVPDNYTVQGVENVRRIVMFCNFSSYDIMTVRGLMRAFDYPACNVYLVPVSDNPIIGANRKLQSLRKYFSELYPTAQFHVPELSGGNFEKSVSEILDNYNVQLIIAPNKKSSAISRFFRPTLAHKILFEKDIPLLAIPV